MTKNILITGASSGIGKACAMALANSDNHLIICGRNTDLLNELAAILQHKNKCRSTVCSFDIRNEQSVKETLDHLNLNSIDVLINNAGLAAGLAKIDEGLMSDWEQMIDTNVKGLLYVSKWVIEKMKIHKTGHIVNISSIAGKEVYDSGNVYCATKHAVDALSKAMRIDLLPHGIKVTNIAPGAVRTAFSYVRFKGDVDRANKVYEGFTPLSPEDVADAIQYVLSRPAHVNINDLTIMPAAQASASNILRNH